MFGGRQTNTPRVHEIEIYKYKYTLHITQTRMHKYIYTNNKYIYTNNKYKYTKYKYTKYKYTKYKYKYINTQYICNFLLV